MPLNIAPNGRGVECLANKIHRGPARKDIFERFMSHVEVSANGCWLWTGAVCSDGYGNFRITTDKTIGSHRFSYEFHRGPIPNELEVDHECHTPSNCDGGDLCIHRRCVNPDHLTLTTHAKNCSTERSLVGRDQRARTHCPQGHEYTPENTGPARNRATGRIFRSCRECDRLRAHRQKDQRNAYRRKRYAKKLAERGKVVGKYSRRRKT